MIRTLLNYAIAFSLIFYPTSALPAVVAPSDHPTSQETKATLEEIMRLLDHTQFSIDKLTDRLDYEFENVVAFVKNDIQYQQYRGLLRGPAGTLVSRSGNALDQAVLLAKLLKDSGYDARIVEAEISSQDASRLLRTMGEHKGTEFPSIGDIEKIRRLLSRPRYARSEFFRAIGLTLDQLSGESGENASGVVNGINDTEAVLRKLNKPLKHLALPADREVTRELVAETREYFFVEYKLGPGDAWKSAHPALPEHFELKDSFPTKKYFASEVPQALTHRVSIQIFIEREWAGVKKSLPVTGKWEAPAANLADVVVSYSNSPIELANDSVDTLDEIKDAIVKSRFFIPTLNDTIAPQASGFDLSGNLFPTDLMDPSKMGIFETISNKGRDAGAAISSLGQSESVSPEEFQSLTRQWIEFGIVAPGGTTRTIYRDIYNKDIHDTPEKRATALTRTMSLTIPVGKPSPAHIFHGLLQSFVALIDARSKQDCPAAAGPCSSGSVDVSSQSLLLAKVFDDLTLRAVTSLDPEGLTYRAEPGLVARHIHLSIPFERHAGDIVHNARRSLGFDGERFVYRTASALKFGVAESVLERHLVGSGGETTAASLLINGQDENWQIIKNVDQLENLPVMDAERSYMERDLLAGYSLVVDQAALSVNGPKGWWRIDSTTGETLGMLSNGTGGAISIPLMAAPQPEYSIVKTTTGVSLIEVVKLKVARSMGCIFAGIAIFIAISTALAYSLSTIKYTLVILAAIKALGLQVLAPTASAMAAQFAQATANWYQLIGEFVKRCIMA